MNKPTLKIAGSWVSLISLLALPSSASVHAADETTSVQNETSWTDTVGGTDLSSALSTTEDPFTGSSPDCDYKCDKILEEYKKETNADKQKQIAESQVYLQCMSYTQTELAVQLDIAMSVVDAGAAVTCGVACAVMTPPTIAACNAAGIASGVGDLSSTIALKVINNEQWSTADAAGVAMGVAGVLGDIF